MYNGQLVKTYDANGNTACYTYDSHNRVTSQSYAGPNYDGYNKYFVYDSATVNGVVMANTAGRMAEAYTAPTSGGAKNTDEGFSYTVRGELSDVYELTPHSGGLYYHTSTTFFENGALKTLSGIPSTSSFLFSIDGKGRPYSAIASPSTNMVGSVTYTPANGPLVVSLGLGDSDSYSYDSTTGFIKTFTNTIGATPVSIVGTMTWNQNGTLRQLAVVDGINASLTETCNYGTGTTAGYDEFGRLVSANCGSVWAQTFSYDGFNNLSKSGSSQWLPGYNQANNHYMLAGTTYDSNGNLLTDTFHTYTWNQDNHPLSITDAGITMSYDALGRLVEKKTGSVYNMTVYSPVGKVATMSGTTGQNLVTYDVALPGGVKAVSNGGVKFMHGDWLGSARLVSSRGNRAAYADRAFAPYGEVYGNVGAVDAVNFTGDLQDMVAGTYDTPNRELNPSQGRWISPDPAHSGWNAYAYTSNPLVAVDPSGLDDLSPMITLTLLDPANQGEGHNVSVFMDSDTDLSAAMNRAYSYTPLGYTILTGTVAVSRSSTQDTYDKDGNLLSSTTTTTTAYFQAGGHDAGKYLGTETTTQTSTLLGIGLPETKDSYDLKGTIQAIGAAGVMQAQKTAAAFCTGGCGTAMKFPGAVASDARSHPYKYAFYAVEAAAAFTPLPEGYAAYEGVKAFGEAAFAAWHLAWDLGW
jgi:RHS repeat-associated protein